MKRQVNLKEIYYRRDFLLKYYMRCYSLNPDNNADPFKLTSKKSLFLENKISYTWSNQMLSKKNIFMVFILLF